jgi:hypothetical protein
MDVVAVAGMAVVATGAAAAGMAGVVAGMVAVTAAAGELDPQSVSLLALECSGAH